MKELFGAPTSTIAIVLLALLGVAIATVAVIAIRNRTWFRMGVRNLPRRGVQTVLVVAGLMLGTLITTAAFVTGDTIDHSLTKTSYDLLQRSDLEIAWNGERDFGRDAGAASAGEQAYVDGKVVDALEQQFANDPDIAGFLPALYGQAAVSNPRTGIAAPVVEVAGYDAARLGRLGGLRLTNGGHADLNLPAGSAYLNKRAANDLKARAGDTVTVTVAGQPHEFRVAGVVENELASGELGLGYASVPGGISMPLDQVRELFGLDTNEISHLTVALKGTVRDTVKLGEVARDRVAAYLAGEGSALFGPATGLEPGRSAEVFAVKADLVDTAEESGNIFTTLFLVLGLFSMAAGVMLIFMIFVMLAAERRAEMGMARAIGAQRGHLIQSFIAEGMAYSLLAGIVGAALGVAASFGMTNILLKQVGGDYFSLVEFKLTTTSLVIGYSLGVVITFLTVVFASMKAAHVNIVSAIRGLADEPRRRVKRRVSWRWVAAGLPALIIPPLGLWFLLRRGLGLPWTWILAPVGLAAGLILMAVGSSSEKLFPFAFGISLVPLCLAALARRFGAPSRPTWTAVGVLLLAYWLLPEKQHNEIFGDFSSDIEMFVISGIMISVASTLVIVFNARWLLALFSGAGQGARAYIAPAALAIAAVAMGVAGVQLGDSGEGLGELSYLIAGMTAAAAAVSFAAAQFPQLGPSLKMAIAYPLANRFRTGMTIMMFSIIVFSLTIFSILLANFGAIQSGDEARGNLDIVATSGRDSGVTDITAAVREADSDAADSVVAMGRTTLPAGAQEVRQPDVNDWKAYPVLAADDALLGTVKPSIESFATGYADTAAVLAAVRSGSGFALMDSGPFTDFSDYDWYPSGVKITDNRFTPFPVQVRNGDTGQVATVTVVGILETKLPSATVGGIYLNDDDYRATFGAPAYQRHYLRLQPGTDAKAVARDIESALALRGVEADSVKKALDDQMGTQTAFNRMFQAFMALGLIVGIAGLGVIAFRSVVERRQQIGMLRAIGFQRGAVTLTFLLESSFIAAMGILAGVIFGAMVARNLLTSDSFTDGAAITFAIPWPEVSLIIGASMLFALLMTWWPSRGASRVPVADALRYE